jgi:hypothetical protein
MGLGGISIWQLIILLFLFLPSLLVLLSKRVSGWKKAGWFIIVFSMWLVGYIIFFLMTKKPITNDD